LISSHFEGYSPLEIKHTKVRLKLQNSVDFEEVLRVTEPILTLEFRIMLLMIDKYLWGILELKESHLQLLYVFKNLIHGADL